MLGALLMLASVAFFSGYQVPAFIATILATLISLVLKSRQKNLYFKSLSQELSSSFSDDISKQVYSTYPSDIADLHVRILSEKSTSRYSRYENR